MSEPKPDGSNSSEDEKPDVNKKNPFTMPKEKKAQKIWLRMLAVVVVVIVAIAAIAAFQYLKGGTYITGYSAELALDGHTANVTYSVTLVNGKSADQTVELKCISYIGNSSFWGKFANQYAVVTVPAEQTITANITFYTAFPDNFFIGNPDPPKLINYTCELVPNIYPPTNI
jgi:hypothetical protein